MLWAVKCFCFASSGLCSRVLIGAVISREGNREVCVLSTSVGPLQGKGERVLPGSFNRTECC